MMRLMFCVGAALLAAAGSRADSPGAGTPRLAVDLGTRRQGIDWPDFLGPRRDSRSPETGLATDWAAHPPRLVWHVKLGDSYAAPSVSRGRVFHFDRHAADPAPLPSLQGASDQEEDDDAVQRLTCRNSETGEELWTYDLPASFKDMLGYNNGPRATPVVDGDRVYIMSPEGLLHCLRVETGEKVWGVDTLAEFGVVKNFFGVGSTPIVWGELLIANIGGSPAGSPANVYQAAGRVEGNGTGVVAFDKLTGEVRWKATDELASYASPVIREIEGRSWCFVFARGGLVALDPRDGKIDFQFPWRAVKLESVNASSPVVEGNEVFISEAYGPGAAMLRVGDGAGLSEAGKPKGDSAASERPPTEEEPASQRPATVWQDSAKKRERAMELHWNTAVLHEGHLFGSSGQHGGDAELRCIEWASGEVKWSERGLTRSSLLYVDGHFVCLSEDGSLRLLRADPERFDVVAEFTPRDEEGEPLLEYPAWAAPVLSHGLLYVRGKDRLVCLEVIGE
jgi:outer membrane protein assembly factor BamB